MRIKIILIRKKHMFSDTKYKILLVEDDVFLVEIYAAKFTEAGFFLLAAENGEKGFEIAQKEKPDLIVLDILLPKMDGFELLKKMKKNRETKEIPVLLLTNLSQAADVAEGLKLGAKEYLVKAHFTPAEVLQKVKMLLA